MFWILVRFSEIAAEDIGPRQQRKCPMSLITKIMSLVRTLDRTGVGHPF